MPLCPRCGEDNQERARFCFACGTALGTAWTGATELRKVVTLLFTDVTGSTSLAERVDAETVRSVMNRYFEAARRVVERHGGTVEKVIGDAVVAVFGVPQVHEDDALRAVRAALELNEELAELNDELEATYDVRLELSTGVSTGEVAVGAGEAAAMGDAVNVAAGLQHDAAPGEILIGELTRRLVRAAVDVEPVGRVDEAARRPAAWRLLGLVGEVAFARRLDSPLVGREQELRGLRQAYDQALDTVGSRLFTVLGAAGIGKSRLVREFVAAIEAEADVLYGRCLPYGDGITYWPLAEVVRSAASIEPELSTADALERIAGLLGQDADAELVADRVAGAIGLGQGGAPPEIFWAVRRLIEALAADRPLVVVFDDIHWAEPTFLDLVEHLAERIRTVPVLLLCMARPELLEERPGWTRERPGASLVSLGPLSHAESSRLIESLEPETRIEPALHERITAAADGNPLFVQELLAMLVDDGSRPVGGFVLPPTIQALLAARLDRLGPRDRDVIGRASVIGQEFTQRAVAALADGRTVAPQLGSLVRKELLDQAESVPPGEGFQFRHLLIRDAAYVSLPKALRADLHERYARYLTDSAGERFSEVEEIVGYQLEQAYTHRTSLGPPDERAWALATEAAGHLQAGGARASARGDLPAAAGLLERALALLPPDDARRPDVQAFAGATLLELGQLERAEHHLAEAEDAARRSGARAVELSAGVARTLIRAQSDPGYDPAGPATAAEAAIPELEQLGADAALAGVWRMLVITRLIEHDPAALEHAAERALETARRLRHARGEAEALFWLSLAIVIGPATVEDALRRYERMLSDAPGPLGEAGILTFAGWGHAMLRDPDEGRLLVRRGRESFRELGFVLYAESSAHAEAAVELHMGDLDAAERVLREGSAVLESVGETASLANQKGLLAWILAQTGRADEALELAAQSRRIAAARVAHAYWRRGRSLALAHLGEHDEALAVAREAVGVIAATGDMHSHAEMLENLAGVAALGGGREEALGALEDAAVLFGRKGCVVCAARTRAGLAT